MQDIIHRIISKNHKLFGENPSVEKINIGFTNLVYRINDAWGLWRQFLLPRLPERLAQYSVS